MLSSGFGMHFAIAVRQQQAKINRLKIKSETNFVDTSISGRHARARTGERFSVDSKEAIGRDQIN